MIHENEQTQRFEIHEPDREEWIKSIEKEMQVFRDRRIFGKASQNVEI